MSWDFLSFTPNLKTDTINNFIKKMLSLGAELDQASSPFGISMIINDAELLYEEHIKELKEKGKCTTKI